MPCTSCPQAHRWARTGTSLPTCTPCCTPCSTSPLAVGPQRLVVQCFSALPGWPQSLQTPLPCRPPCTRLECNRRLYAAQAPAPCALSRRRRHLAPHDCGQDCRRRGGPGGRGWLGPAGPRAAPADVAQHQVSGGPGVPPAPPHAAPHLAGLPGRRARLLRPGAGSSATSAQFE